MYLKLNRNIKLTASETTDGGTRTDAQTGGNVTIEVQGNLQNTDTGDPTRVGEAPEVKLIDHCNFAGLIYEKEISVK